MKQAILTFDKCQILLVEGDKELLKIISKSHLVTFGETTGRYIGKLSELTEEVFAEIVDKFFDGYIDYESNDVSSMGPYIEAEGSFLSKLRAEGYYTEMPEIKEEPSDFGPGWNLGYGGFPQRIVEEIDAANARLFPPDKTYLFKIVKQ